MRIFTLRALEAAGWHPKYEEPLNNSIIKGTVSKTYGFFPGIIFGRTEVLPLQATARQNKKLCSAKTK